MATRTVGRTIGPREQVAASLAEYKVIRSEMRMRHDDLRRDMRIFLGAIAVLVTGYLADTTLFDARIVALIAPPVIFAFYIMQVTTTHIVNVQAKACARIERRVNALLGHTAMDWESVVAPTAVRGPSAPSRTLSASILLASLGLFGYFAVVAYHAFGVVWLWIDLTELLIMMIGGIQLARFELRGRLPR